MMNNMPANPMQVIQMLRNGMNPTVIANQLIQRFPEFQQAARFMNGKTPQEIQNGAHQMAQQRGIDLNQLSKQLGIKLPK